MSEADFYEPLRDLIEQHIRRRFQDADVVCVTLGSNDRLLRTGGTWTRPDVVAVVEHRFHHSVPSRRMEIWTFEIKKARAKDVDIVGVYEAAAHKAAGHRSFAMLEMGTRSETHERRGRGPSNLDSGSDLVQRALEEALRLGVGLVLFKRMEPHEEWRFQYTPAKPNRPDPHALERLLGAVRERQPTWREDLAESRRCLRVPPATPAAVSAFSQAVPWPHAVLDDLLRLHARRDIAAVLDKVHRKWRRAKEAFYEHEVCNFIDLGNRVKGPVLSLVEELGAPTFVAALSEIAGVQDARLEIVSGHRLRNGDRIGLHSDEGDEGDEGVERSAFRLLLCAAPDRTFEGGVLELYASPGEDGRAVLSLPYEPGQGFLFRLSRHSWHAVSAVSCAPDAYRFTVVATYSGFEARR